MPEDLPVADSVKKIEKATAPKSLSSVRKQTLNFYSA